MYFSTRGKEAQQGAMTGLGVTVTKMDLSQGTLKSTGNSLDFAIEGDGFFTIQTKDGDIYTRNGSFVLNTEKELVTQTGDYVLGESGKIVINGKNIVVSKDGSIYVDETIAGKLKISFFEKPQLLQRSSKGGFVDIDKAGLKEAESYGIAGGYLEMSNVNVIQEMTEMIGIQRAFESYQKMIQTLQDLDKISSNKIGKLI
jgi:flagellar basal-body rod protein FlgG